MGKNLKNVRITRPYIAALWPVKCYTNTKLIYSLYYFACNVVVALISEAHLINVNTKTLGAAIGMCTVAFGVGAEKFFTCFCWVKCTVYRVNQPV